MSMLQKFYRLLPDNFALEVIHRMLRMEAVQRDVLEDVETHSCALNSCLTLQEQRDKILTRLWLSIFNKFDRTAEAKLHGSTRKKQFPSQLKKFVALCLRLKIYKNLDPGAIQTAYTCLR